MCVHCKLDTHIAATLKFMQNFCSGRKSVKTKNHSFWIKISNIQYFFDCDHKTIPGHILPMIFIQLNSGCVRLKKYGNTMKSHIVTGFVERSLLRASNF